MEFIKQEIGPFLYFFGYTNHPDQDNINEYFTYETHEKENLERYYGFKTLNERWKSKLCKEDKVYSYKVNDPTTNFDIVPKSIFPFLQIPAKQEARKRLGMEPQKEEPYPSLLQS